MSRLKAGDRVRLKVRSLFGWKGTGTVTEIIGNGADPDTFVEILKDGSSEHCTCCRHELAKIRTEAPRPKDGRA